MPPSPALPASSSRTRRAALGLFLERFGPLLALILLIAGAAIVEAVRFPPGERAILTVRNFANIFGQWSYVGIVALGMTFVILLGGIDLSVGAMVALSAGGSMYAMNAMEPMLGPWPAVAAAIAICIVAGTLLGLLNGVAIAYGRITPFIATLGTMAAYRALIVAPAQASEIGLKVPAFKQLNELGLPLGAGEHPPTLRLSVFVFLGMALLADVLLKRTVFGRRIYAVGDNPRAAKYAGVNIARTTLAVYAIAGLTCGVAAVLLSSRMSSVQSKTMGDLYELDAIAAVVIGGTRLQGGYGRIWGTVIGVLILGVVSNMLNMLGVSNFYHGLVKGLIILAAVLVQPRKAIG